MVHHHSGFILEFPLLGPQVQQIPQAGVFLIVGLSQAVLGLEDGVFPPQGGVLLLQGGDGPAQQIPPHRIGEEGEAVKVDVQIEEEVGPGGVLDPADQF